MTDDLYSPVEEDRRQIALGPIIWGSILILIGAGWLLTSLGVADIPWRAALAAVLIVIGIGSIAAAANGADTSGLFTAGTIVAIVLALLSTASATFSLPLSGGVGERNESPSITTLESEYRLIAGELDISLADVAFPVGETRIDAAVTFGSLRIRDIPDDVVVSVEGEVIAGELRLLGSRTDGVSISDTQVEPGFTEAERRLVIEATVGFGEVRVSR